jgi:hypothetical protein
MSWENVLPKVVISISFKKNFFRFSKEWVPLSEKHFFNRKVLGQTLRMQQRMCSMTILRTECCLTVLLNGSDMGSPGHHTLQI